MYVRIQVPSVESDAFLLFTLDAELFLIEYLLFEMLLMPFWHLFTPCELRGYHERITPPMLYTSNYMSLAICISSLKSVCLEV